MKDYPLEIDFLYREDIEGPVTLYSKGHHAIDVFKAKAMREFNPKWECDKRRIKNLQERTPKHIYAKKVGYFEEGKRVGYTLNLSEIPQKGYFPVTVIDVW